MNEKLLSKWKMDYMTLSDWRKLRVPLFELWLKYYDFLWENLMWNSLRVNQKSMIEQNFAMFNQQNDLR